MDPHRIVLALEPEAASIWCKSESEEAKIVLSGVGSRYMVIDLGGMHILEQVILLMHQVNISWLSSQIKAFLITIAIAYLLITLYYVRS